MKTFIKCSVMLALTLFIGSITASAHPTVTGKSYHAVYVHQTDVVDVNLVAVVGGDVIHPPCYIDKGITIDKKGNGFDSAILPEYYKELKLYCWYVPQTIGKPLTKSEGSINWQSKLFLRTNHDRI